MKDIFFFDSYNNQTVLITTSYKNVPDEFVREFIADIEPSEKQSGTVTHSLNALNTKVTLPNDWIVTTNTTDMRKEYTLSTFNETLILANHIGMGACEEAATSEKWECIYDEYKFTINGKEVTCDATAQIETGSEFTEEDAYLFSCELEISNSDRHLILTSTTFSKKDIESDIIKDILKSIEVE